MKSKPENEERNAAIIRLREEGNSFGVIAQALRISRNTVVGVVWRYGVQPKRGHQYKRLPAHNQRSAA